MRSRLFSGVALSLGLVLTAMGGCSKEEPEETFVEPVPEAPEEVEVEEEVVEEVAEVEEEAPAGPTADTVPIPEDFADEAAEEITAKNYKDELAAMEKDLAADE